MTLLPPPLLDRIVSTAVGIDPSLRIVLLALGSKLHASASRVLFHTVSLPDDARLASRTQLYPLITRPTAGYAANVRRVHVTNAVLPDDGAALQDDEGLRGLDAEVFTFLNVCPNLEELIWESAWAPPDGLAESLSIHNPRLSRISFTQPPLSPRCSLKWDAPSLPLLATLPLTSIRVSRLSQAGARAFSRLLEGLGAANCSLENLCIDFVWLDETICQTIAQVGKKLRSLTVSTAGTKLSDGGLVAILEGCEALESFTLDDVQGTRIDVSCRVRTHLLSRSVRVVINEGAPQHSWAVDHLESIHALLSLPNITSLEIIRREILPTIHGGVAIYDGVADDTVALKPVPTAFMDSIKDSQLASLRCDFWSFTLSDMKRILDCSKLEHLFLCLDGPFSSKLTALTSSFANLRTLTVSVLPIHAPGKPPVPSIPNKPHASLPTPSDSPILKSKAVLPPLLDLDKLQPHDPSMPLLRDVKRLVRKCPRLELLDWCGRNGRGSWVVGRPSATARSTNVVVEYVAPELDSSVWIAAKREQTIADATARGWGGFAEIERPGSAWVGATADAFAAERLAAEKEREEAAALAERSFDASLVSVERRSYIACYENTDNTVTVEWAFSRLREITDPKHLDRSERVPELVEQSWQ
ncbi:hypothetical protein MKEN_00669000 [Mycena kentingensis (nom. inval.)]|nr:hypothetical protein MKEN_00669000 [Mycena kentingensis (nom. inval.)]